MYVMASKKMPVMFAGEGIVGAADVGVGRVAPEWNLYLVSEGVAGLRRTCGDSLE